MMASYRLERRGAYRRPHRPIWARAAAFDGTCEGV